MQRLKHPSGTRLGLARCFYLDAIVTIMPSSPTLSAGFWRETGVCRRGFLARCLQRQQTESTSRGSHICVHYYLYSRIMEYGRPDRSF